MVPGNAGEAAQLVEDRALNFFGQHKIGELQGSITIGAVSKHHGAREITAERQILKLDEAGFLRQNALIDGLQHLIGPDGGHGDDALGKKLQRLRVAGGVCALVIERRGDICQQRPCLAQSLVAGFLGVIINRKGLGIETVGLMDGAADEVAAGAALVGTVINELAGICLDPLD
ncbi:hypothetical protein D3C80_486690 [compost metagenome]